VLSRCSETFSAVGTYYDFEDRIIRGPYRPGITAEMRKNGPKGRCLRNLKEEKEAKKKAR
jgi:hypothetical protein